MEVTEKTKLLEAAVVIPFAVTFALKLLLLTGAQYMFLFASIVLTATIILSEPDADIL